MNKELNLSFDNEKFETELSIFDISFLIIKHKFQIFMSGIVFLTLGFLIYLFVFPYTLSYEIKIKIHPPSSEILEKFQNKFLYNPNLDSESSEITKEYIVNAYIEEFETYDALQNIMRQKFYEDINILDEYQANKLINENAKRFYIKDNHIQFLSTNLNDDLEVIDTVIKNTINKVGKTIYLQMEERFANQISEIEILIAESSAAITSTKSALQREKVARRDFLSQQLLIANELQLTENQLFNLPFEYEFDMPYYMKGTDQIKAELKGLSEFPFHSESLSAELNKHVMNMEVNISMKNLLTENFSNILNDLSSNSSNFIRINVSDYDSEVKPNLNIFIPFLFLIFGLLFYTSYLILRSMYLKRASLENTLDN